MNSQFVFLFVLLFLFKVELFAQKNISLGERISKADSVLVISHAAAAVLVRDPNEELKKQELIEDGKLNYKVVEERKKLVGAQRDSLIKLLTRPVEDDNMATQECFVPHHAIIIYKNKKVSYLNICFSCLQYRSSKDMEIERFDSRRWKELKKFFKKSGIKWFPEI